ncbi:MAG: NAD-dependent epimerase/dehydratase family protein [Candidatus Shapirobacteria bacterium]|jgi:dihydroflavonol-4-reductase
MKQKTVGVTGATGNIGKFLVRELLSQGYRVRILTRQDNYRMSQTQVFKGDIGDTEKVRKFIEGCAIVFHLAVYQNIFDNSPERFFRVNVGATEELMKLMVNKNTRLVLVSTAAIFKDRGDESVMEDSERIEEDGNNWYEQSKLKQYRSWMACKKKINSVVVYPTIVIDSAQFYRVTLGRGMAEVVKRWCGGAIPGGIMLSIGDQNRTVNFVEVRDVARGLILAAEKGQCGEDYILGGFNIEARDYRERAYMMTGLKKPLNWLVSMAYSCLKPFGQMGGKLNFIKNIEAASRKNMKFKIEKSRTQLGYKPEWAINPIFDRM